MKVSIDVTWACRFLWVDRRQNGGHETSFHYCCHDFMWMLREMVKT